MSESEELLRRLAAAQFPQPKETRDPLARAIAKGLCLLAGLGAGAGLLWLAQNSLARFVGQ